MINRKRLHRALDAVMDANSPHHPVDMRDGITFNQFKAWVMSRYPTATFSGYNAFAHKANGSLNNVGSYDDIRERGYLDVRKSSIKKEMTTGDERLPTFSSLSKPGDSMRKTAENLALSKGMKVVSCASHCAEGRLRKEYSIVQRFGPASLGSKTQLFLVK